MKKKFLYLFCFLAVLVVILLCYRKFFHKSQELYVNAVVQLGDVSSDIVASAKIDAIERVSIGAQVSGQVNKLYIKTGDLVKKGELIALIDDQPQRSNLRDAQAGLSVSQSDLKTKEATFLLKSTEFKRLQKMNKLNLVSQQAFDQSYEAFKIAQAELIAQKARLSQAQIEVDKKLLELSYTHILSPMDGIVIAIITKQGQTVNAAQSAPTIAKIAQLDTMLIKAQISEADINKIKVGQKAWFTTFSNPEKRYQATLSSIELAPENILKEDNQTDSAESLSVTTANGAIYYNALFIAPNPAHHLRIAMTAQVYLTSGFAKGVLLIPIQAVKKEASGLNYVNTINSEGEITKSVIETGISDGINIQVKRGLNAGEKVILASQSSEQDKVIM